ncbi:GAF domain-containing protein [Bdellovibrio bacteriovorus]|uniref:GAF domain-containing protein n=1 Tax=Bdellovibrio TaxID=958 RepID=UPI0035A98148
MSVTLSDLACCLEGVVPSIIATCSKEGVPNVSYLSHVFKIDEKHVATSYQFFNKTRANLLENPLAVIKVRHPGNLQSYNMKVKYLRSEEQGPVYQQMSLKLDVIAAYEGMGSVFKLKAADIYEVVEINEINNQTDFPMPDMCGNGVSLADLELLRVISDKISSLSTLEDFLDHSMHILNRYLGWSHMILLLADPQQKSLITHSSFGYSFGGVGAEVKWGEGLIGLCAEHGRLLQVSALGEGLRYAQAVKQGHTQESLSLRIPLPGLTNPASQIAAPLSVQGEFIGVLAVESATKFYWGVKEQLLLSTVSNFLAVGIRALENQGAGLKAESVAVSTPPSNDKTALRLRFVSDSELIFVNDQYLIKNIPARILWYLLQTYHKTGRSEFSNMELRAEKSLQLPEVKDNLETRLILLRKRLEEQCPTIRLHSTGRGRFRLEVCGELQF